MKSEKALIDQKYTTYDLNTIINKIKPISISELLNDYLSKCTNVYTKLNDKISKYKDYNKQLYLNLKNIIDPIYNNCEEQQKAIANYLDTNYQENLKTIGELLTL